MQFEFYTSNRIIFGCGKFKMLPELIAGYGRRAFFVTGKRHIQESGVLDSLEADLGSRQIELETFTVDREPTVSLVDAAVEKALSFAPDAIVGLGGGSAVDLGKAVSGCVTNGGSVRDYLEGVGKGEKIDRPSLPFIAIPTSAGTGSEVTKNAVITGDDGSFKKSIRSEHLIPEVALVDAELTRSMPAEVTAACGLDAVSQLMESYTSRNANPMTDALALTGLRHAARSLKRAWEAGSDIEARNDMSLAATLSGITLANAGLGAVHGLASPLGAFFPIHHGTVCALLLPAVIEANADALQQRDSDNSAVRKYRTMASIWNGGDDDPAALAAGLRAMNEEMLPGGLSHYGVTRKDFLRIIANCRGSSMKYNPVELSDEEICSILSVSF